jgi:hypothetical protein
LLKEETTQVDIQDMGCSLTGGEFSPLRTFPVSRSLSLAYCLVPIAERLSMGVIRRDVTEFLRAGKSLLAAGDLSEEEEEAVKDMLWQLVIRFPDEGDDAAD